VALVLTMLTGISTRLRWGLRNGMGAAFGAESFAEMFCKARDYTLEGIAHQIVAPTLILDVDNELFLKSQPQLVKHSLTGARTTLVTLTGDDTTNEHTHASGLGRTHQTMFEWLNVTLAGTS
jgi:hypothetical protein